MIKKKSFSSRGISLQYIYSACVITRTPDVTILHDPWFTQGIYDGSWHHFPCIKNPIEKIGFVDAIFVSHVHPDHYDPKFLKLYFKEYGVKKIFIADHNPNHLENKMIKDGFHPQVITSTIQIGNTQISILPHKTGSVSDIDSALIIKYDDGLRVHCVVNANDIIFDTAMLESLKFKSGEIDIFLCGYTGAGPYPQTYFDVGDPLLDSEAEKKKLSFFERYMHCTTFMNAKINIPFAGLYLLGGKLTPLNSFRGNADPTDLIPIDKRALILAEVDGHISTSDLIPSLIRTKPYDDQLIKSRLKDIACYKMDYERLIDVAEIDQLPIKKLIAKAALNARQKSECETDYFFAYKLAKKKLL
jgi:hypothetical protein